VAVLNRRSFLASVAAAIALDPERALWVPGKKLITVGRPPIPVHLETMYSVYDFKVITRMSAVHGNLILTADLVRDARDAALMKLPPIALRAALNDLTKRAGEHGFPPLGDVIASTLFGAQV
jgi:hypothetical protein